MLENTDGSIDQIAAIAGFKDTAYFYRVFKRKVDKTPSEYRTLSQKNQLEAGHNTRLGLD